MPDASSPEPGPEAGPQALATSVLTRYLRLCDVPAPAPWDEVRARLAEVFTEDAVWTGAGTDYAARYGVHRGRAAILAMLARHLPPSPHFAANVHLLFPADSCTADADSAHGVWLMQQLSRYADGTAEMRVARLTVAFRLGTGTARIQEFRTERLFTAALPA
ncbi:nuclear transport factor 2 family protein [Streptomyces sp. NPDC000151]|uniref:nuclear transport factor 2 family protein n=1 Tax=Streptomyces sp. NPDC000151 TaxID=3154244 RepID=UPI003333F6E0